VIPYGTVNSKNTHEDYADLQAAAKTLSSVMTTSGGDSYTVAEAHAYPTTAGNGQTRDWSYKYTGYAFSLFLDNDR